MAAEAERQEQDRQERERREQEELARALAAQAAARAEAERQRAALEAEAERLRAEAAAEAERALAEAQAQPGPPEPDTDDALARALAGLQATPADPLAPADPPTGSLPSPLDNPDQPLTPVPPAAEGLPDDELVQALNDALAADPDTLIPPDAAFEDEAPADGTESETAPGGDPLAEALAYAVTIEPGAGGGNPDGSGEGPGLTAAEIAAFRDQVAPCWNLGPLSVEARQTTITMRVEMTPDAVPVADSIRFEAARGPAGPVSAAASTQAFEAARRAVLRCTGATGYPLPRDRYERWREVVINFHPEGMAIR